MDNMFWIIFWAISMLLFILLPLFFDKNRRRKWLNRIPGVNIPMPENSAEELQETYSSHIDGILRQESSDDDNFHYVLSKAQQNEIRESFILLNIRDYSLTLEKGQIKENETTTRGDDDGLDVIEQGLDSETSSDISTEDGQDDADPELPIAVSTDADDNMGNIVLPQAGEHSDSEACRRVRNGCAVCLSHFEEGSIVTWSSNSSCPHAFHQGCVIDWLMMSGRKHLKRMRRQDSPDLPADPVERVIKFPMLCPCCRQDFVIPEEEESSEEESLKEVNTEETQSQEERDELEGAEAGEASVSSEE